MVRKDKADDIEFDVIRLEEADRLPHPAVADRPPAHLRSRTRFCPVGADRLVEMLRLLPAVVGRLVDLLVSSWGFSFVGFG